MRKKILFLNTTFKYEGPNDVFWNLARSVDPSRFEIIFGCMYQGGPMEKVYREAGYKTNNLRMESLIDLGVILRLSDFIRSETIDLVMAQLLRAEVFGGCAAWLARVPLIMVIQNVDPYRANPWFSPHYYLSRLSMRWPIRIVACSESVRQFVIRYQDVEDDRIVTIHDAIDPKRFFELASEREKVRNELEFQPDEVVIGVVARLDVQKGLSYLLEAFRLLCSRCESIRLIIVGSGPKEKEFKSWVKEQNMEEKIVFTGFRRDYEKIIQAIDIFVLPSLWEGLPLVLLGAMAAGKAVVSTTVSGITEVVRDGVNGLLVPPANATALANRIENLIRDCPLRERLGTRAKEQMEKKFSAKVMAERYERLWDECLSRGNRIT